MSDPGPMGTQAPQELDEAAALRLLEQSQVGRIGYSGRYGLVILPVNYKVIDQTIVFRTDPAGALGEDLRTGIPGAGYKVAFEVDELDAATRTGWSVLVQGTVRHVEDEAERAGLAGAGLDPWAGGQRSLYLRITPTAVTGRRLGGS